MQQSTLFGSKMAGCNQSVASAKGLSLNPSKGTARGGVEQLVDARHAGSQLVLRGGRWSVHACGGAQNVYGVVARETVLYADRGFWHCGLCCESVCESARKCQLAAGANAAKVCESEGYMARLKLRKWRGPAHVLKLRK